MIRHHVLNMHRAVRNCRRQHKGARLNTIRNYRMLRAAQLCDSLNLDGVCARALDLRAHLIQKVREIAAIMMFSVAPTLGKSR